MQTTLKITKTEPDVILPNYQTPGSAGFDLHSNKDYVIRPNERLLVATGLKMELEVGTELQIRPRSGLSFKEGITVLNSPGTIDSDYRGEVHVMLINHSTVTYKIKRGDRVAQGVVLKLPSVNIVEVTEEELTDTERSKGGFGSTGR